jgi:hypothetical protein
MGASQTQKIESIASNGDNPRPVETRFDRPLFYLIVCSFHTRDRHGLSLVAATEKNF